MTLLSSLQIISKGAAAVLVIVAVFAEVFPVGTISRIIVMVAIFVMNCKLIKVACFELPPAFGANPSMQLERFFPITLLARLLGTHFPHQLVDL